MHSVSLPLGDDKRTSSRSGFRGVRWDKRMRRWQCMMYHEKAYTHIGWFDDPVAAARAYDAKARALRGAGAWVNFPEESIPYLDRTADGAILLPLTQGKSAIVDAEDYPRIARYKWTAGRSSGSLWYASRGTRDTSCILLHRVVMDAPDGVQVDHINGDGLDCRKANLRFATPAQNAANKKIVAHNTSGYRGVSWDKHTGSWYASIMCARRSINLGHFVAIEDAARAYDAKARELFGPYARTNFSA